MSTKQEVECLIESVKVLEQVLDDEKVLEAVGNFPELTNSLNDNLDLAKRLTEESKVPSLLGPIMWKSLMAASYTRTGAPDLQVGILNILSQALQVPEIVAIIRQFPEAASAFSSNQNLATAIVNDGFIAQMMENVFWRQLVKLVQISPLFPQDNKVQCADNLSTPPRNPNLDHEQNQALSEEVRQLRGDVQDLIKVMDCSFRVSVPLDLALKVLPICARFQIKGLTERLAVQLENSLTLDTCIKIFQASNRDIVPNLWQTVWKTIAYNFKLVVEQAPDFGQLTFEQLTTFVFSGNLSSSEWHVFSAICKWITTDLTSRKAHTATLLKAIRFESCTLSCLQKMRDHELLSDQEKLCHALDSHISVGEAYPAHFQRLSQQYSRCGRGRTDWSTWASLDDVLFVMGGREGDEEDTTIDTYIRSRNIWSVDKRITNAPKGPNVSVALGHLIFVVEYKRKSVRALNPATRKWRNLSPMHLFREGACLAQSGKMVYAMGGKSDNIRLAQCEYYDSDSDSWTVVASMNRQRNYASAATLNGRIYCSGGYDGIQNHCTAEAYDPKKDTWTFISPMHESRQAHCLVSCGNYLWAVGGSDIFITRDLLERYDPVTDVWTRMSLMPTPRFDLTVSVVGGHIFAIGGEISCSNHTDVVEVYDPSQNSWTTSLCAKISRKKSYLSSCVIRFLPNAQSYA